MALALVTRARGRRKKSANFWQKSSTFDPISEGTRRKKRAAGPPAGGIWLLRQLRLVRDPVTEKLAPVHAIRGTMAGKLARDPAATKIDPAAAARGP